MTNSVGMAVVECLHYLKECVSGLLLREMTFVYDPVKQLSSFTQLHGEIDISCVFEGFVQLDDVRVILLIQILPLLNFA